MSLRPDRDLYETLGIGPGASQEEVRRAYLSRAKEIHPDRVDPREQRGTWRRANDRMKELNEAYSVLGDPDRRREYDLWRRRVRGLAAASGNSMEDISLGAPEVGGVTAMLANAAAVLFVMGFAASGVGGFWLLVRGEWKVLLGGLLWLGWSSVFVFRPLFMTVWAVMGILLLVVARKFSPAVMRYAAVLSLDLLVVGTCVLAFRALASPGEGSGGLGNFPHLSWSWLEVFAPWCGVVGVQFGDREEFWLSLASAGSLYELFLAVVLIDGRVNGALAMAFVAVQVVSSLFFVSRYKESEAATVFMY